MLTRDGTHRYVIHASAETEAALNALREFAEWTEREGYTDTGDLWEVCAALFEAITGGETLPCFDNDEGEG